MTVPLFMSRLDSTVLWLVVSTATLLITAIGLLYALLLVIHSFRIRNSADAGFLRKRFLENNPYSVPRNLVVSGIALSIVTYLTQMAQPLLLDSQIPLAYFVPALLSLLSAIIVVLAKSLLQSRIRKTAL